MDFTTAQQSSASFPVDAAPPPNPEFYQLAARLADPHQRREAARALARLAGAEDLVVFVHDAVASTLLPAPGFMRTMPDANRWRAFLSSLSFEQALIGTLPYPARGEEEAAAGVSAADGSAVILLGGTADLHVLLHSRDILPILAAAFRTEQEAEGARGEAAFAREAAGQAKLLTASLDNARQALQKALLEAETANKAKDNFLAVLSHELRTPLAPVLTTVSALLTDESLSPALRESLEIVRRNADLEVRLIDDLLDLTRVARGKMHLNLGVIDAHGLVKHTLEICRSELYRKKLALTVELKATAWHVNGDATRLQQALWNLVKNAIKFTQEGGAITIRSFNVDDQLTIDVEDSGIGIDPRFLPVIFNAFEQTDPAITHRFGGLGLGLAISKALVDAHHGKLSVRSAGTGAGATFSIVLPTVPEPQPASAPGVLPKPSTPSGKLRLLFVEDHADTSKVMTKLLRGLGHHVSAATTVADAIQLADRERFDFVISDLGLPDGSGIELMEHLRARHGLRGIAVSGYGMDEDVRRTHQAGFIAHLTKPVNFQQVVAVIAQLAGGHGEKLPAG